ncbi:proline racemase family protein [Virgibacillus ndiopensis]|uniref:proline racemase family protein n=1 Tax=Virgibacillus ndiopensis TaxID=2004408 RepID=UPI000C06D0C9|nr:proline racemase family protein [Virgibacillus ndiopensis]
MNFEKMFSTIDTHVAGEAFRIIIHSAITLNESSLEMNHASIKEKYVHEKELLLNEPRGHRGMNGLIVAPSRVADFALLFVNHDSGVRFKYGGLVTTVTALLETGNLAKKEDNVYEIETVNGIHLVYATYEDQEVEMVRFESEECRVMETTEEYELVEIDSNRNYLIYSLPDSIPGIHMDYLSSIIKWGKQTAEKVKNTIQFDGILIRELLVNGVRSVTFENDGSILRSPGIDSTFAIFTALLNGSGNLTKLTNQSIFDSKLTARLIAGTDNRFSVETRGFVTGTHQFIYDQEDPLKSGFLLK